MAQAIMIATMRAKAIGSCMTHCGCHGQRAASACLAASRGVAWVHAGQMMNSIIAL